MSELSAERPGAAHVGPKTCDLGKRANRQELRDGAAHESGEMLKNGSQASDKPVALSNDPEDR
jgi:hypothetical protein